MIVFQYKATQVISLMFILLKIVTLKVLQKPLTHMTMFPVFRNLRAVRILIPTISFTAISQKFMGDISPWHYEHINIFIRADEMA